MEEKFENNKEIVNETVKTNKNKKGFSYTMFCLQLLAIFVSYLMLNTVTVAATNINILFNGQVKETTAISTEALVNKQISIKHEPTDLTWTKVKVLVNVNGASLSNNVKKIYLFKCKNQNPVECAKLFPQAFDKWVDTELLWSDISVRKATGPYPQVANLLFLIELESLNQKIGWTGFWTSTERIDYNVFNQYSQDIGTVELNAKSLDFVGPIKTYIETYNMVPFNWITSIVFRNAQGLFAIGGNRQELELAPPALQTARPSGNEIKSINKDYFIVFPETSSGAANPVTLNLNPSFSCGDGKCESDLGETSSNCCYDCGCSSGFCDIQNLTKPATGRCRDDSNIALQVDVQPARVNECRQGFLLNATGRVLNPPGSLLSQLQSRFVIDGSLYNIPCSSTQYGIYACQIPLVPKKECGAGRYVLANNAVNLSLAYNDGPNTVSRELGKRLDDIVVNYDCSCSQGLYCDIARGCSSEGSISMSIINVTSFLRNYNPQGDWIYITAKINNPASDLAVIGTTYSMNGTSGSLTCQGSALEGHIYSCKIPIFVPDYNHSFQYIFSNNSVNFSVQFSSGPLLRTLDLASRFSDITIPSYRCGDLTCNPEENSGNCCYDCGCPAQTGTYCDTRAGCQRTADVGFAVDSINPTNTTDCTQPHSVEITSRVINPPGDMNLLYSYYIQDNQISGWSLQCKEKTPGVKDGVISCSLAIPAIDTVESRSCQLPYYRVGPNKLNITISWTDGPRKVLSKTFASDFSDIHIIPQYHCGNGIAEPEYGENASNCCIDVPCETDPAYGSNYYCDYNPSDETDTGTCRNKNEVKLVVDSPKATVHFDSCEITNFINIKAHIDNQPSNMQLENVVGELDGKAAQVNCMPLIAPINGSEQAYSFNCTMLVPREFECHQGKTYNYKNNKIGFFISYPNGRGGAETQMLSSGFADAQTTQKIRSLKDIIDEGIKKLRNELYAVLALMDQALKRMDDCIKMMFAWMLITVIMSVAGFGYGIASIGKSGAEGIKAAAELGGAIGLTGSGATNIVAEMCKMMMEWYKMMIEKRKMNMEILKMEMCLQVMQNALDSRREMCANGQEENCFFKMVDCVDPGKLDSFMKTMSSSMDKVGQSTQNIGSTFQKISDTWTSTKYLDALWGVEPGDSGLRILWGGVARTDICSHDGLKDGVSVATITTPSGQTQTALYGLYCKDSKIGISFTDYRNRCQNPHFVIDGDKQNANKYPPAVSEIEVKKIFGIPAGQSQDHTITIYCDRNNNGRMEDSEKYVEKKITVVRANEPAQGKIDSCECPGLSKEVAGAVATQKGAAAPTGPGPSGPSAVKLSFKEVSGDPDRTTATVGQPVNFQITATPGTYTDNVPVILYVKDGKEGDVISDQQYRDLPISKWLGRDQYDYYQTKKRYNVGRDATGKPTITEAFEGSFVVYVYKGKEIATTQQSSEWKNVFSITVPITAQRKIVTAKLLCEGVEAERREVDLAGLISDGKIDSKEASCKFIKDGPATARVVVYDSEGMPSFSDTKAVVVGAVNQPPSAPTSVSIKAEGITTDAKEPTIKSMLTCIATGGEDPEKQKVIYKYKWEYYTPNGLPSAVWAPIAGAERETLSGVYLQGMKGKQIRCKATPTDGSLDGPSMASDPVQIVNARPKIQQDEMTGTKKVNQQMAFRYKIYDLDDNKIKLRKYIDNKQEGTDSDLSVSNDPNSPTYDSFTYTFTKVGSYAVRIEVSDDNFATSANIIFNPTIVR